MRKRERTTIVRKERLLGLMLILLVCTAAGTVPCEGQETFPVRAPAALPGTTEDMLSPDFWIDRVDNPDHVLMTLPQIGELNGKNAVRVIPGDHPYARSIARIERDGPSFQRMDPLGLGDSYRLDTVRERLTVNNERLMKGTFYDYWALPLTDGKKAEYLEAVNLEALPVTVKPQTAMIVRHTSARLYPTPETAYRSRGYLDDNNVTSLDIGMPAAILHASKNADYYFVMTPIAWGWVPATDIAVCDPDEIHEYRESGELVVVTDHKVPVYASGSPAGGSPAPVHAGYAYMGERLPLVRKTAQGYVVRLPGREFDGSLTMNEGIILDGEGVHEGFLPYTQRNAITTAFKLLERPYGWHDSWGERDCGGIMRVIFNCFGFTLPRYWSFEQLCSDHATYVGEVESIDEKNKMLCSMPAGVTFTGTTGHISLYLGNVDGVPYSIHQCGWNYKEGGTEYKMARVVVSAYQYIGYDMKRIGFFTPIIP